MIHEYAVDPALLNNWERFRYLTEKFGVCRGRLISRFPKRWKAMVYDGLSSVGEIERKRIEICLQRIDEKMLARAPAAAWDGAQGWLLNAELEHERQPFHAIVAGANPRDHGRILAYDDLSEDAPLWAVSRERAVSRAASSLAAAVSPILRIAKKVIFVDPHFDPYRQRALNTLRAFLNACLDGRLERSSPELEFHTAFRAENAGFAVGCQQRLPEKIPRGMSLKVVRWRARNGGDGLHNRYILTERGGVRLAWGLDEGSEAQTDDLSLLEPELYKTRWDQYCGDQPAFDRVDEIVVSGTRVLR